MIISPESVIEGFAFVARRLGIEPTMSVRAIHAALDDARRHAATTHDEPAAVFFAFARFRRAFPRAWRQMAALLSMSQARELGLRIHASAADYDELASAIMLDDAPFDDVRAWFESRLKPTR